ncbi:MULTISPECIES: potassium channel family protein [Paenibacillus]|uniref:Potassium uptake system protein n=3 Tax=Paenibacillus TaxID=44249 RepID=A0A081P7B5_9BACL|nr:MULTISPECIES: TrkA family potassium uptake protein [Paenibacillus]KEQ26588.1 potassium uptake system protein [Paenibacillus tyrfis]MBU7314403.1 TrkA family potassium uptake protein [Paenibacillus oleatilyticus]MCM3269460.1 TrkA family potassium uptake protein [Paenibacillus elgii]PUA39522.1 TrkA family potassium uptake protein [Paenibacillus elgii]GMX61439.1 TrkA family potassium uptake protein [Paenibacillus elgii]
MKRSQYAVIGLGRFGSSLAKELIKLGYEVLGIDKDEEAVEEMSDELTHVVVADATDEDVIRSLGIRNFDCVVVSIGDDIQASILTAILLKDSGVGMVVAKALSELHGKVLQKIGVDRVIYPERDMGIRVAHQLVSPNLLDYIELSKDYTIAELAVPRSLNGRSLKELDPRARYGCSVVAINKKNGVIIAPTAEDMVEERDVMVVIGTNEQIETFENEVIR